MLSETSSWNKSSRRQPKHALQLNGLWIIFLWQAPCPPQVHGPLWWILDSEDKTGQKVSASCVNVDIPWHISAPLCPYFRECCHRRGEISQEGTWTYSIAVVSGSYKEPLPHEKPKLTSQEAPELPVDMRGITNTKVLSFFTYKRYLKRLTLRVGKRFCFVDIRNCDYQQLSSTD